MPNNTKRFITVLVLACVAFSATAQSVTIKGKTASFKGKTLLLNTITDYINNQDATVATSNVAADGSFSFDVKVPTTSYYFIADANKIVSFDLYLEPGKNVEVFIPDTTGFSSDSILKPMEVRNAVEGDLTTLIRRFDSSYDKFLVDNYKALLMMRAKKKTVAFLDSVTPLYTKYNNKFLNDYIGYKSGSMLLLASVKTREALLLQHYYNKPILYSNNAYMALFGELHEGYFASLRTTRTGTGLVAAIKNISYEDGMKFLAADTLLVNDTLREMVFIKGLGEIFYDKATTQFSVLELLKDRGENGLTPQNRLAAINTVKRFEKLRVGTEAPAFKLKNIVTGDSVSLADFKGKYVYLSFWDEGNPTSIAEIDLIREFDKKYGRKITFICISNSPNATKTLAFITRNKYKWVFLNSDGKPGVLSDYDVLAYPAFYLIDTSGNIFKNPAARPSANIELLLDALYKKK